MEKVKQNAAEMKIMDGIDSNMTKENDEMKREIVIRVENVRKYFKIYKDKGRMLRERIISLSRNQYEKKEVLRGVSFNVAKGETVGLIGKNGCGKSTTLKLLTKILSPNEGKVIMEGRVCSLIELGAGFHPDMSGRENVYINASIFGLNKKEIDAKLADIIRFSELEDSIDNPVRTYSSGMYMRLAFSVAINVNADILLIDEILAVGDQSFQTKCFNRLRELKNSGVTIVLVSHALGQVESICDRAIWLEDGKIRMDGSASKVCQEYQEQSEKNRIERAIKEECEINAKNGIEGIRQEIENKVLQQKMYERIPAQKIARQCSTEVRRLGTGKLQFVEFSMLDEMGAICNEFKSGSYINLDMQLKGKLHDKAYIWIQIRRSDDDLVCFASRSKIDPERNKRFYLEIPDLCLKKNHYFVTIGLDDLDGNEIYDQLIHIADFIVKETSDWNCGIINMKANWKAK